MDTTTTPPTPAAPATKKQYVAVFCVVATNKTEQLFFTAESYISAQDYAADLAGRELNERGGQKRVALYVRPVAP